MGVCAFCGEPAGFLRSEHAECRHQHDEKVAEQNRLLAELEHQSTDAAVDGSSEAVAAVAAQSRRPELRGANARGALVRAYGNAIDRLLESEGVGAEHEKGLSLYASTLGLTDAEKDENGAQVKLVKALVLRDAAAGEIKSRINVSGVP